MKIGRLGKNARKKLDEAIQPLIKRTLYLPANDYIYGSAAAGAVRISVAPDVSYASCVDNAFKLLSPPDGLSAVTVVTSKRLRRPASVQDIKNYVFRDTGEEFRATATQVHSV